MKALFSNLKRRTFLSKIVAGVGFSPILYRLFSHSNSLPLKVVRIVNYPRPLTQGEFESMSEHYCNHLSIQEFTGQLISQGRIVGYDEDFGNMAFVKYTLYFSDVDSYNTYLKTIDENWFDFSKFKELGFSVNIETNSQTA